MYGMGARLEAQHSTLRRISQVVSVFPASRKLSNLKFSAISTRYEQRATIRVISSACLPRLNCCTSPRMLSRISPADCF